MGIKSDEGKVAYRRNKRMWKNLPIYTEDIKAPLYSERKIKLLFIDVSECECGCRNIHYIQDSLVYIVH